MITLRIATVEDASALAEIYQYYVDHTTITFEYSAPDEVEFAHRIAHKLEKYPYLVAEEAGRAVGYAYASEFRERPAFGWNAELSVYVARDKQGCGIGKRLYSALIELLRLQHFVTVYACITSPNPPSVSFHERSGFEYLCSFPTTGYKHGRWIDVIWYQKRIGDLSEPLEIIPFPLLDDNTVKKVLRQL